jgi:hypothetical protein
MEDVHRRYIYWILVGPRQLAGSRLQGYLLHENLKKRGWRSVLLYHPAHMVDDCPLFPSDMTTRRIFFPGDVVVFQKINGPKAVATIAALRTLDVKTLLVDCDPPPKRGVSTASTITVCSSHKLAALYQASGMQNTRVMPEPHEHLSTLVRTARSSRSITCVWFGSMDLAKADEVRWLRDLLRRRFRNYRLVVISNSPDADYQWELEKAWDLIKKYDIAVITGNESERSSCKSPNRLIQAMALGLPVIAYPVPSYRDIVRHGRNGYLCNGEEEWTTALTELGSITRRVEVANLALRYVRRCFGTQRVISEWEQLFKELGSPRTVPTGQLQRLRNRWDLYAL